MGQAMAGSTKVEYGNPKQSNLKKQSVRQAKLVRFSRFQSCPAKVSRPAGMKVCVS